MIIFLFWILLVLVVAYWAKTWNRSFGGYALLSFLLSPIIGAIVLIVSGKNATRCVHCAEEIRLDAKVCKHCHKEVVPVITHRTSSEAEDIANMG